MTCRRCHLPMSPAERAAYGSFCEDCSVGSEAHAKTLEKFSGTRGFSSLPASPNS
jgi:hypothetical protein